MICRARFARCSASPVSNDGRGLKPPGTDASDVETLADKRLLPTIRVKAPCCHTAERAAHHVTGQPVLRAERVEEVAA